ncbi:unnamed protein product, partial [marine sediment metagenome]
RSIKIAGSAAVAAAIVTAAIVLVVRGGSTVVMAAVLEQLQTQSYEFEMEVTTNEGGPASVTGMVLEPGRMRLTQQSGAAMFACIIDDDAGQSLILIEQFKAAYRLDREEARSIGGLNFLILPGRSISDLWNLKAEDETELGRKNIDGKSAEGFRVTQEEEEHTQTITVWADAKTGHPLEVEILVESHQGQYVELTLSDFQVVSEPDPALFSTELPAGYTLANRQTLEQLGTESAPTTSTADDTTDQARRVVDAIAAWADGKRQKAVELLMAVDWGD